MIDAPLSAQADLGPVTKVFLISDTGELLSPIQHTAYRTPLLRASRFYDGLCLDCAPGLHAWRFGHMAAPDTWRVALAICRIPSGTKAVISPWAIRAEALLIERILLAQDVRREVLDAVRHLWAPHCDVALIQRGRYTATVEPLLHFRLKFTHGCLLADANRLWLDGHRYARLEAHDDGIELERHCGVEASLQYGPGITARAERVIRRWYEYGSNDVRDILIPWLRYFDYLRQPSVLFGQNW